MVGDASKVLNQKLEGQLGNAEAQLPEWYVAEFYVLKGTSGRGGGHKPRRLELSVRKGGHGNAGPRNKRLCGWKEHLCRWAGGSGVRRSMSSLLSISIFTSFLYVSIL